MRDGKPDRRHRGRPARARAVPEKQIALLQTFADQAVIAIENVRLFKELEARTTQLTRSVEQLRALSEVGQAVSSTLDLETVLSTIVSRATQLAEHGRRRDLRVRRGDAGVSPARHATGFPTSSSRRSAPTPVSKGEGAVGRLATTGEPVAISDIRDEGMYQSRVREILLRLGYRSVLAVPLLREDRLLGGLVVNRKSAGEFAPRVDRPAEDLRDAVGPGDPERAAVPRDRGEEPAARGREPAQERSSSPTCRTSCARR